MNQKKQLVKYALMTCLFSFQLTNVIHAAPSGVSDKDNPFKKGIVAVWMLSDLNDTTKENSKLQMRGNVPFITLQGEETAASKIRGGDAIAAVFNGGWLEAGQGINNEMNLTGKQRNQIHTDLDKSWKRPEPSLQRCFTSTRKRHVS